MKINFSGDVKPQTINKNNDPMIGSNFNFKSLALRPIIQRGSKGVLFHLFALICLVLFFCSSSTAAEIIGPEIKIKDNVIYVTTSLSLEDKYINELKNGITKEYIFYIDIFRVWKMWPDEFIYGKIITKTLECDPVKREYRAISFDGSTVIEKRFRSFESMLKWATAIEDLRLKNLKELDPGKYYIRVSVESKIRKLPPVIGYFMIFIPENEFKINKNSPVFKVGLNE